MASSMADRPTPPSSTGMASPGQSRLVRVRQRSPPSSSPSVTARISAGGHSLARISAAASCRPRWSSSSSKSTPHLPFASSEALELDGHRRAPRFGLAGEDPALGQLVVGEHVVDPHLHGALLAQGHAGGAVAGLARSEEHTSELQSLMRISYAVFCLKKKKQPNTQPH